MQHSNLAGIARLTLGRVIGKSAESNISDHQAADTAPSGDALTGTTFIELEPDLAKEAGQYTRDISGWAAGGQPPE